MPFFKVLEASASFDWGLEQQEAFEVFKAYLENIAVLASPTAKAELILYISTSDNALGAVLVEEQQEHGERRQVPIYYVSKALSGSKLFYSEMEKLVYTVVMAKRKLHHYFESHLITVPNAYPLRDILENKEATSRIGKWAAELGEYVINFVPRSAIKSLALADFFADWTFSAEEMQRNIEELIWEMMCDGAYCDVEAGCAAILTSPSGIRL